MKASSAASPLRQRFIRELRLRGFSSRTVESYVSWVYDLARHHHKSPDQLSDEHLKDYLLYLHQERSLTNNTIRVAVNALRSFYTLVQGRALEPLKLVLVAPRLEIRRPEIYSVEEVHRLLSVGAVDVRARAFLATVYSAGLRLNEACHLRVRDVLRDRRQIRVEQGKGNKDRYTILADGLLPILREYYRVYRPQQWLFPSRQSQERPILDATGQRMYEQALARAQLPHRGGIHSLRHSFSTHLLESGVEVTVLQRLLGHRSIHSTLRYLHLRSERLQQIKSPLDRALEPKQPRVKSPKEHAPSLTPQ
jgi:site-specific recombinase XerD